MAFAVGKPAMTVRIVLVMLLVMLRDAFADDILEQLMYLKEPPAKVFPILEFRAETYPLTAQDPAAKPAFLYDPTYQSPRIVEFYAHWCPHCQHFKPKYIQFARQLHQVAPTIEVWAVSCVPNRAICRDMGIKSYPAAKLFPAHSINATDLTVWNLHPFSVMRNLGMDVSEETGLDSGHESPAISHPSNPKKTMPFHFMHKRSRDIYQDAHLSFLFTMKTAIYTSDDPLDDRRKSAWKDWLTLVQKTLPPRASLHGVVDDLIQNFDSISYSDKNLTDVLERNGPSFSEWSPACRQHGTGYTCGLWQLFHIVTIGLVEWNLASSHNEDLILQPQSAAEILRNFVANFFMCEECRLYFLQDYDSCGHDRCNRLVDAATTISQWKEFPLWLYETHNSVNARLRRERIERNDENNDGASEQQVLWPAVEDCPVCWRKNGVWDMDHVYDYLRLQYWPLDAKGIAIRNSLHVLAEEQNKVRDEFMAEKKKARMRVPSFTSDSKLVDNLKQQQVEAADTNLQLSLPYFFAPLLLAIASITVCDRRRRQFRRKANTHKLN